MEQKKAQALEQSIEKHVLVFILLLLVNLGMLYFLHSQVSVIGLLKDQLVQLQQDQQVLASAEQIYQTYKNDIDTITAVFPDEGTILVFLQTLETLAKDQSDQSSVKFASFSPTTEGDKLYLLFTVTMVTDKKRLSTFLGELENLPYMTRLLAITINWSDPKKGILDVTMKLKVYVKNPFSIQQ